MKERKSRQKSSNKCRKKRIKKKKRQEKTMKIERETKIMERGGENLVWKGEGVAGNENVEQFLRRLLSL